MKILLALASLALAASAQMTPATVSLSAGQTQKFAATCPTPGCDIHDWSTAWICGDGVSAGSIDASGMYTAPAKIATLQTVHLSVMLGDLFAACVATVTLQPSATPPPPPPPPPTVVNPVPWMLGWPFVWFTDGNGLLMLAADPTLIPAIQTDLPALGSACSGVQFSDGVTELRACVGGKWHAIAVQ